jgi:arylsulfatase A-like enzyme
MVYFPIHWILLFLASMGQASSPCLAQAQGQVQRPNVVLILADDLGWGDPECYSKASKIPTPQIDALATEGSRFTDAHSPSSVCTPTRYGILTGRYAWRRGLKSGVLWPWDPPLIEVERATLAEKFQEAGYETACIGKWHLGWDWPLKEGGFINQHFEGLSMSLKQRNQFTPRIDFERATQRGPLEYGFDYYFGDDVPNFPPYAWIENDRVVTLPTLSKPEKMFGHAGPAAPGWDLAAVMPVITQRAGAWISERNSASTNSKTQAHLRARKPFFLYFSLTAPHTPIAPSPRFSGVSDAGHYGDFVAEVDWAVGEILQALKAANLDENTIVIFTSDNGSPARNGLQMSGPVGGVINDFEHNPSAHWRGLKSDAWEGGHRVPFIVRWPDHVPASRVSAAPIIHTDLYRTLATLIGLSIEDGDAPDSFDQAAEFLGLSDGELARDHLIHHSGNGTYAIRQGDWKLILGRRSGGFSKWIPPKSAPAGQLYNLQEDPSELDNLYEQNPDKVAKLTARLEQLRNEGNSIGGQL